MFKPVAAGAALIAAGLLAASALAQDTVPLPPVCGLAPADHEAMDHGDHGAMDHGDHDAMAAGAAAPSEAHAAMQAGMDAMHGQMMEAMAVEDFDVAFVCGMIPHHQGAIVMAQTALEHSEDAFVRGLAEEILAAQQAEIAAMLAWLEARD